MNHEFECTWDYFFEDETGEVLDYKYNVPCTEAMGLQSDHYLIVDGHEIYGTWHPFEP